MRLALPCTFDHQDSHPVQWVWLYQLSLLGYADAPQLHGLQWGFNSAAPLGAEPQPGCHPFLQQHCDVPRLLLKLNQRAFALLQPMS